MLLGGALRGRSPRTREGRIGPTAQNCSSQWSVVGGQRKGFAKNRVESVPDCARLQLEVKEISPPLWNATPKPGCLDSQTIFDYDLSGSQDSFQFSMKVYISPIT